MPAGPPAHEPACNLACVGDSHRLLSDREAEWFRARDEREAAERYAATAPPRR